MNRSLASLFVLGLLLIFTACGDGVGPVLEPTEFELCSQPNWILVRNGSTWNSVEVPAPIFPFGPVRVSVPVAPRISIAFGFSGGTQIYDLLKEELDELRCTSTFPPGPFRSLTGSVTGIPDGSFFQMAYSRHFGSRTGPGTFTSSIKDTIATIVATHRPSGSLRLAGVLLIRDFRSNGENAFPPLDFSSAEVRALDSAQVSFSGNAGTVFRSTTLRTVGTVMSLEASSSPSSYYALTGPSHPSDVYSSTFSSTFSSVSKTVTWHYAGLSGKTEIAFGPNLPDVQAISLADSRCRRIGATLAVQPELAAGARFTFSFSFTPRSTSSVSVFQSAGFRGSRDRWEVEIPDFGSDRPCANSSVGSAVTITTTAFGGNFLLELGAPPRAGDLLRSVSASRGL